METDDDLQEIETNTVQVWANIDPPFIDGLLNDTNLLYMIKLVRYFSFNIIGRYCGIYF